MNLIIKRALYPMIDKINRKITRNNDDELVAFDEMKFKFPGLFFALTPKMKLKLLKLSPKKQEKFIKSIAEQIGVDPTKKLTQEEMKGVFERIALLKDDPLSMPNDLLVNKTFAEMEGSTAELYEKFVPIIQERLYKMNDNNKRRFVKALEDKVGINLENIVERENIGESLQLAVEQNLNLIKSLSEKQLSRAKNVVLSEVRTGNFDASRLKDMLVHDFGISERHAEFIARDQTHKLNSNLNQLRLENVGVTHYTWMTSQDRRVRGDPTGKYPNARPSHYIRQGKTFAFKNPPSDGNPGEPINCRCYAAAHVEHLLENY